LPCGRDRSEATVFCPQKGRFSLFSLLACGRIQDQDPVFMRVPGNWFDLAAAAAKGIETCLFIVVIPRYDVVEVTFRNFFRKSACSVAGLQRNQAVAISWPLRAQGPLGSPCAAHRDHFYCNRSSAQAGLNEIRAALRPVLMLGEEESAAGLNPACTSNSWLFWCRESR
jgi:hypothetical protein